MENNWSVNRIFCAVSGPLGKLVARTVDRFLEAQGLDKNVIEKGRKVASQGGAFLLAAMGAPEAALSIASSAGSQDLATQPVKVNPHVADAVKGRGTINADVKG